LNTVDPETGKPAIRETNTMPQWAGSCWYYLRYIDPHYKLGPVDPKKEQYWMPVDLYVGGAEHAVLHLLYARFWHKVLYDCGVVSTKEPFRRLVNQGMILGEMEFTAFKNASGDWISPTEAEQLDQVTRVKLAEADVEKKGESFVMKGTDIKVDARSYKMSKSRGNVINPDDVIRQYGADALRLYEMFMGPLEQVKPWSMRGVEGVYRFLSRIWRLLVDEDTDSIDPKVCDAEPTRDQLKSLHEMLKKVTDDIEAMRFNTAISAMMIFVNDAYKWDVLPKSVIEKFLTVLQPFAPHIAEEIWSRLGHTQSISSQTWPAFDMQYLVADSFTYAIQINGKVRGELVLPAGDAENKALVLESAKKLESVSKWIEGKPIVKEIFIPKKIVNIVVAG
jgi:leucyl-tRNA synthetase